MSTSNQHATSRQEHARLAMQRLFDENPDLDPTRRDPVEHARRVAENENRMRQRVRRILQRTLDERADLDPTRRAGAKTVRQRRPNSQATPAPLHFVAEVEHDRDGHVVPIRYVTAPTDDFLHAKHIANVLGESYRVYEAKLAPEMENQQ